MNTIQAIETQYKGYRFRSRLEARWAVFFDKANIEWQYEPEGYEREWNGENLRYLPDFYLPKSGTWVEVKGNMTEAAAERLALFLDYGCPLPLFDSSDCQEGNPMDGFSKAQNMGVWFGWRCYGLLVLGDIPEPIHGKHWHTLIRHNKGLIVRRAEFCAGGRISLISEDESDLLYSILNIKVPVLCIDSLSSSPAEMVKAFSPKAISFETHWASPNIIEAYRDARSARFEHGETP